LTIEDLWYRSPRRRRYNPCEPEASLCLFYLKGKQTHKTRCQYLFFSFRRFLNNCIHIIVIAKAHRYLCFTLCNLKYVQPKSAATSRDGLGPFQEPSSSPSFCCWSLIVNLTTYNYGKFVSYHSFSILALCFIFICYYSKKHAYTLCGTGFAQESRNSFG
jgi:hypothetical protein